MATVELRFSALPGHVRTARLVAASVARRAGVPESLLDEVRLAVGEACSRAVSLHRKAGLDTPVRVALYDEPNRFSVEVSDAVPAEPDEDLVLGPEASLETSLALISSHPESLNGVLGLAVITGLVDDVDVRAGASGAVVRMSWPAGG